VQHAGEGISQEGTILRLNVKMKDRYEDKIHTDSMLVQAGGLSPAAQGICKRRTVTTSVHLSRIDGWNKLQRSCNKQKRTENISDNLSSHYQVSKRGLPKPECVTKAMKQRLLNIRHGNGASVVVRAGESPVHGQGKQLLSFSRC
jgi:hypothetical protein